MSSLLLTKTECFSQGVRKKWDPYSLVYRYRKSRFRQRTSCYQCTGTPDGTHYAPTPLGNKNFQGTPITLPVPPLIVMTVIVMTVIVMTVIVMTVIVMRYPTNNLSGGKQISSHCTVTTPRIIIEKPS